MAAADEIAEKLAQRISLTYEPAIGMGMFVRWWKPAAGKLEPEALATLKAITSVTDPKYENGTKTAPGVWTVVHADWDPKLQGYVQHLQFFPPQDGMSATGWNDGVAGDGTTVAESIFEKTEQKDYFDQSAVPAVTLQETGIIRSISAAIDRWRRWRVSVQTTTAVKVTADAIPSEADVYGASTEQSLHNYPKAEIPAPVGAGGVLKRIRASLNRFGLWDVSVSTKTAKEVSYTFPITTHGGTEVHTVMRNQATLSLPTAESGRLIEYAGRPQKNDDDTWNWHAVSVPESDAFYGQSNPITTRRYGYKYVNAIWGTTQIGPIPGGGDGKLYKWRITVYVDTTYRVHATAAAAWAAGQGKPDYLGAGRWLSTYQDPETVVNTSGTRVGAME